MVAKAGLGLLSVELIANNAFEKGNTAISSIKQCL
jgi:hypothetical protein